MSALPRGVVSFDLDGTLWDFGPMMEGALAATVRALEERLPTAAGRLSVEDLHAHRRAVAEELTGSLEELRLASFERALRALEAADEPGLAPWLLERLAEARAEAVALHDDVVPALEELHRRGYVLGAITNGNFPFARLEIARRFEFVVHAEEVGALKPAAEPFTHAATLCGGEPGRWVHVGDDLDADVAGAQACGMRAVWLNRTGAAAPRDVTPDAVLDSLARLPDVVERLLAGD